MDKLLFGQIAIERGYCSQKQIDKAIDVLVGRAVRGDTVNLGIVMVEMGILTQAQVDEILKSQHDQKTKKEQRLFGKLAIYHEFCTEADIQEAIEIQDEFKARGEEVPLIGEILIRKAYIKPQERDAILALQKRLNDPNFWKSYEAEWQRTQEY